MQAQSFEETICSSLDATLFIFADIIHSGESLSIKNEVKMPVQGNCTKCGYISSQPLCKACVLLEGLNRGLPRLDTRLRLYPHI